MALPAHLQKLVDKLEEQQSNFGFTITEIDPFPPENIEGFTNTIEKIFNESVDETIERKVNSLIEQGIVKLEQTRNGWTATISNIDNTRGLVYSAYSKIKVYQIIMKCVYEDYVIV